MNRGLARIGVVTLTAIATVGIAAGTSSAGIRRAPSTELTVRFSERGDLGLLRGRSVALERRCGDKVYPDPFVVAPFGEQRVTLYSSSDCRESAVTWQLSVVPTGADRVEDQRVLIRFDAGRRPTVHFLDFGQKLRWTDRVGGDTNVEIEVTAK